MNDHDELTRALGRALGEQVEDLDRAPFVLGDVKVRAGRIRRHRRIAAGAGLAAALAVIVPAAMFAGTGLDRADRTPGPVTQEPSGVQQRDPVHETLVLAGLPRGEDAAIEYFTVDGVFLPGQGLVAQDPNWQALVPSEVDGGWLAYGPARDEVRYLTEEFQGLGGSSAGDSFVTNPDRSYAAWTAPESGAQTVLLHSTTVPGEGMAWDFPERPPLTPVGILGEDRVLLESSRPAGGGDLLIAEPDGSTSPFADVIGAEAVSVDGLVSVMTRQNEDASACFGLVDAAVDPVVVGWETCDYSLGTFSPDGRYVLAGPAYLDGVGDREVTILDARSHEVVAVFDQPQDAQLIVSMRAWESESTVLAVVSEGDQQGLIRLGVDGTMERASDLAEGSLLDDLAFWLGVDRLGH